MIVTPKKRLWFLPFIVSSGTRAKGYFTPPGIKEANSHENSTTVSDVHGFLPTDIFFLLSRPKKWCRLCKYVSCSFAYQLKKSTFIVSGVEVLLPTSERSLWAAVFQRQLRTTWSEYPVIPSYRCFCSSFVIVFRLAEDLNYPWMTPMFLVFAFEVSPYSFVYTLFAQISSHRKNL